MEDTCSLQKYVSSIDLVEFRTKIMVRSPGSVLINNVFYARMDFYFYHLQIPMRDNVQTQIPLTLYRNWNQLTSYTAQQIESTFHARQATIWMDRHTSCASLTMNGMLHLPLVSPQLIPMRAPVRILCLSAPCGQRLDCVWVRGAYRTGSGSHVQRDAGCVRVLVTQRKVMTNTL